MENDFIIAFLGSPPFFPATMLLLKAGKKGGTRSSIRNPSANSFQATGKIGYAWKQLLSLLPWIPSLLPGHYAIIKGREEGRGKGEGEDSMLRRVHPKKRSVSWVNSVPRQFLPNGSLLPSPPFFPATMLLLKAGKKGGEWSPCAWRLLLCVTLSKQRECWKLRDSRLNSEFDSRIHDQPSNALLPPFFPAFNNSIVAGKKGGRETVS